jgi:hypothetical protein
MMGKFLEQEKKRQKQFKVNSPYFSAKAKAEGYYRTKYRPFCLPEVHAEENLFHTLRDPMMGYFSKHDIKWHDGHNGKPSNHLCDSQVCCANFLFPFSDKPDALASLLSPVFPALKKALPLEDNRFVAFEWIGLHNYLQEGKSPDIDKRTRGAFYTRADAAVKFLRSDGLIQLVLIEWKYTESYSPTSLKISPSRIDRTNIYACLYNSADCIFNKEAVPGFGSLFFEPFYQLMRQQFLAKEMEKAHELEADLVSLLHIVPRHNLDYRRITSPPLEKLGNSPTEVWQKLVRYPGKFTSVYTEELFGKFDVSTFPELHDWWNYMTMRYSWVVE